MFLLSVVFFFCFLLNQTSSTLAPLEAVKAILPQKGAECETDKTSLRPYSSGVPNLTRYACAYLKDPHSQALAAGLGAAAQQQYPILSDTLFLWLQSQKPSPKKPLDEWDYLGPFLYGKTEYDGDPLVTAGGPLGLWSRRRNSGRKGTKSSLSSEIGPRAEVRWKTLRRTMSHTIEVDHSNIGSELVESLGTTAVMEFVGYAFTDIVVLVSGLYKFQSQGIHTFFIDETPMAGDQFGRRYTSAAYLPRGLHTVHVRLRGVAQASFSLEWLGKVAESEPWSITSPPPFLPDVAFTVAPSWAGFLGGGIAWVAVPVSVHAQQKLCKIRAEINTAVDRDSFFEVVSELVNDESLLATQEEEDVAVHDDIEYARFQVQRAKVLRMLKETPTLQPQQMSFVRVPLRVTPTGRDALVRKCKSAPNTEVSLHLALLADHASRLVVPTLHVRCRSMVDETFVTTFLDFDGAVSHMAVRYPKNTNFRSTVYYPVVLSLHGTGVTPGSQADAYKVGDNSGKYSFGIDGAFVCAVDRHGAHNWEGVGKYSALAALFTLYEATAGSDREGPRADKDHVVYKGHSMGGHGALILATQDPTRSIGVVLLATWISKEHYGVANAIHHLDRSTSHLDGFAKGVLEASVSDNAPDLQLEHLLPVPVLLRTGGSDHTVSPFFARRLYRMLKEHGHSDVTYSEPSGKGHWWWDSSHPNDGGCMNDPEVRDFLARVLQRRRSGIPIISAVVVSPFSTRSVRGIQILDQKVPFMRSSIRCTERGVCNTTNVLTFTLRAIAGDIVTTIDGVEVFTGPQTIKGRHACFTRTHGEWGSCKEDQKTLMRRRRQWGPLRAYMEGPFVLVLGPRSSPYLHGIVHYIANSHFVAYDTIVPIVIDDLDKRESASPRALRRVLFAIGEDLPEEVTTTLQRFPFHVSVSSQKIQVAEDTFTSDDASLVLLILTPPAETENCVADGDRGTVPRSSGGFLIYAQSIEAMNHAIRDLGMPTVPPMMRPPFGNMLPDVVVSDAKARGMGLGSIRLGAYMNRDWSLSRHMKFTR